MTLNLTIPADIEARLRERAVAIGEPVEVYASKVLMQAVALPTIDELLAPVREEFRKSGTTDEELMDLGHRELDAMRDAR